MSFGVGCHPDPPLVKKELIKCHCERSEAISSSKELNLFLRWIPMILCWIVNPIRVCVVIASVAKQSPTMITECYKIASSYLPARPVRRASSMTISVQIFRPPSRNPLSDQQPFVKVGLTHLPMPPYGQITAPHLEDGVASK